MSGTIWSAYNVYSISPVNKQAFSKTEDVKIALNPINKLDVWESDRKCKQGSRKQKKTLRIYIDRKNIKLKRSLMITKNIIRKVIMGYPFTLV